MVQLCCTSRAGQPASPSAAGGQRRRSLSSPTGARAAGVVIAGAATETRLLSRSFGEKGEEGEEASITIEYHSSGHDADAFDSAFEKNDLAALVGLLKSDEGIERLVAPKHPWAEDPCTIGALAAMQLALLSSMVAKDDPGMKVEIGRAGAIEELVEFLRSAQEDRVQAAIVALNYLTDDCSQNAHEAFKAGAMPLLIALMGSPLAGMRGALASTVRNMCMESEEYCETFTRLGGIRGFVNQLDVVSDPYVASDPFVDCADLALEAVCNLEDVMTDKSGKPIKEYAKLANEQGACEKLERLRSVDDQEVSVAAEKVLACLAQAEDQAGAPCAGG